MSNLTQDCSPDWPGPKFFFYKTAFEGKRLKNCRVFQNKKQKKESCKTLLFYLLIIFGPFPIIVSLKNLFTCRE
jgi:hypothetical protein